MKYFAIALIFAAVLLCVPSPAQAIIILPAIILIPIAKIVAIFIGALSLPALSLGVVGQKLFGTTRKKVIFGIVIALILAALVLAIFLKVQNGDRPWF